MVLFYSLNFITPRYIWLYMKTKTQEEIAKAVGTSQSFVSLILTGQRRPSWRIAKRFAQRPCWNRFGRTLARSSFSHFVELLKFEEPVQRAFYEIECIRSNRSKNQQFDTKVHFRKFVITGPIKVSCTGKGLICCRQLSAQGARLTIPVRLRS